ncbi:MAG: T9SS type A sorting domain-containing protein [bacterium]|nr:T9SS type A sorting domain-containing protein [bacterium]
MKIRYLISTALILTSSGIFKSQQLTVSFLSPDTVCINQPFSFTNTSTGPLNGYYWNVCSGSSAAPTFSSNLSNPANTFSGPAYIYIVNDGGNFYAFVTNNFSGRITRLDYGSSLNNTPTATDLGFVINNLEDVYVEKEGGNWYGLAAGGTGLNSAILRLSFGSSITNIPTVTNMGNIGNLNYPVTLNIFLSGGNKYGLTFNQQGNTITRFSFGNSISNTPTAVNLGNVGGLSTPSQMAIINSNGNWNAFICNDDGISSVSRIDFGNSLLNTPTGVNLGNLGGYLNGPRGICLWNTCDGIRGLIANRANNLLFDLYFPSGATGPISIAPTANTTILSFPQTIRRIRIADYIAYYIVNVLNNSISRINVSDCQSSPSTTLSNPPAISFSTTGTYTAYLRCNESEINQGQYCKKIVAVAAPQLILTSPQTICLGKPAVLTASGAQHFYWNTGATTASISVSPFATTVYTVQGWNAKGCSSQKTTSVNVSECIGLKDLANEEALKVFPNPSSGKFEIETITPCTGFRVYNQLGILEKESNMWGNSLEIDLGDSPDGIYFVKLSFERGSRMIKILKTSESRN